jgi:CheY-like chemotaxis protein
LLREHPQCGSVPIIVITSSDSPKERAQMSALGVSAYFRKPTDLAGFMTLGRVVHSVLQNGARSGNLSG